MQDIFHQEIYVKAVPPWGAKYQISAAGGEAPMWRREGKELFYISADRKLTAVPITLGSTVVAGSPQPLFTFFDRLLHAFARRPALPGECHRRGETPPRESPSPLLPTGRWERRSNE